MSKPKAIDLKVAGPLIHATTHGWHIRSEISQCKSNSLLELLPAKRKKQTLKDLLLNGRKSSFTKSMALFIHQSIANYTQVPLHEIYTGRIKTLVNILGNVIFQKKRVQVFFFFHKKTVHVANTREIIIK